MTSGTNTLNVVDKEEKANLKYFFFSLVHKMYLIWESVAKMGNTSRVSRLKQAWSLGLDKQTNKQTTQCTTYHLQEGTHIPTSSNLIGKGMCNIPQSSSWIFRGLINTGSILGYFAGRWYWFCLFYVKMPTGTHLPQPSVVKPLSNRHDSDQSSSLIYSSLSKCFLLSLFSVTESSALVLASRNSALPEKVREDEL